MVPAGGGVGSSPRLMRSMTWAARSLCLCGGKLAVGAEGDALRASRRRGSGRRRPCGRRDRPGPRSRPARGPRRSASFSATERPSTASARKAPACYAEASTVTSPRCRPADKRQGAPSSRRGAAASTRNRAASREAARKHRAFGRANPSGHPAALIASVSGKGLLRLCAVLYWPHRGVKRARGARRGLPTRPLHYRDIESLLTTGEAAVIPDWSGALLSVDRRRLLCLL